VNQARLRLISPSARLVEITAFSDAIPIVSCKLQDYSKSETTLMLHRFQRTPELHIARLVPVSICLCAFILSPVPHLAALAWAESAELECPCKEDGKRSEKELTDWCSAHGRSNVRRRRSSGWPPEKRKQRQRVTTTAERVPAIIGHQLANGLCAPLLI
jgi:hypothetical protein